MSSYTTINITREKAERMVRECRNLDRKDEISLMSKDELDRELHRYVYSEDNGYKYRNIIGFLYNYNIN